MGGAHPVIHHGLGYLARPLNLSSLSIYFPFGFHPAHDSAGAVDGGTKRRARQVTLDSFQNYGILANGPADESALTWKCRRGPLANHPQHLTAVLLPPGEIVVIVDLLDHGCTENPGHPIANPVSTRICIPAAKPHAFQIVDPQFGGCPNHTGIDIHSVLGP